MGGGGSPGLLPMGLLQGGVADVGAVQEAIGGAEVFEGGALLRQGSGGVGEQGGGEGDGTAGAAGIAEGNGAKGPLREGLRLENHQDSERRKAGEGVHLILLSESAICGKKTGL